MTPVLESIGVLVLGAVVVLLLVGPLSTRPPVASIVGLPFYIVAGGVGLEAGAPIGLAVAGLCGVGLVASLLLPVLEAEVPAHVAEAAALLLLGTAGAVALASATDLLQVVVGLETLALSAVILVALSAGDLPLEAAFKYFVLGAISLASLLYGVGLVYLSTGTFGFPSADQVVSNPLTLGGMVLIGLGIAFEMAVVPFHWGALDAYTAAAPGLAGFVMSASKLAAAFALGRVLLAAGPPLAQVLVWIGCLTIAWGTFGAIAQASNLRRMLAYSAVTHAGFIALAVGSGPSGPITAAFYAAVYGSMAMLVFAALSGTGVMPNLRRIGQLRAVALALGLFSLSGVPPTPGFWAKLAVLVVAWQAAGAVPTLIAVAGGVFSVLYYLRPLPDLFASMRGEPAARPSELGAAASASGTELPAPRPVALPGVLLATATVIVLGLFPSLAWNLAR